MDGFCLQLLRQSSVIWQSTYSIAFNTAEISSSIAVIRLEEHMD